VALPESGGAPATGIEIRYRGEKQPTRVGVHYDSSTSWGVLCAVLMHFFPNTVALNPIPDFDADLVQIFVDANPKSMPAPGSN
jgi:hypothetical protein